MIGEEIVVRITQLDAVNVRIGIEAPKDIEVHREEIYKKINDEDSGNRW